MITKVLISCGYEKMRPEVFFKTLAANKVQIVVDVRRTPFSKRTEMNIGMLERVLLSYGIEYVSFPSLGIAKRHFEDILGKDKNYRKVLDAYESYIRWVLTRDYEEEEERPRMFQQFQELCKIIDAYTRIAFMGYLANHNLCHRKVLIQLVQEYRPDFEFQVINLS